MLHVTWFCYLSFFAFMVGARRLNYGKYVSSDDDSFLGDVVYNMSRVKTLLDDLIRKYEQIHNINPRSIDNDNTEILDDIETEFVPRSKRNYGKKKKKKTKLTSMAQQRRYTDIPTQIYKVTKPGSEFAIKIHQTDENYRKYANVFEKSKYLVIQNDNTKNDDDSSSKSDDVESDVSQNVKHDRKSDSEVDVTETIVLNNLTVNDYNEPNDETSSIQTTKTHFKLGTTKSMKHQSHNNHTKNRKILLGNPSAVIHLDILPNKTGVFEISIKKALRDNMKLSEKKNNLQLVFLNDTKPRVLNIALNASRDNSESSDAKESNSSEEIKKQKRHKTDKKKKESSGSEEHVKKDMEKAKALREAYGDACLKVSVKKCHKACKYVRRRVCDDFRCNKKFRDDFEMSSRRSCIMEFGGAVYYNETNEPSILYRGKDHIKGNGQSHVVPKYTNGEPSEFADLTRIRPTIHCLPGYTPPDYEHLSLKNGTPTAAVRQFEGLQRQLNILRDKYERECVKTNAKRCQRACDQAYSEAKLADKQNKDRDKKFKKYCKSDCWKAYGVDRAVNSDETLSTDVQTDSSYDSDDSSSY